MGFIPMNLVETTIWWLKKAIALQETPPVCGNKHDFNRRVSFKFNQPMEKTENMESILSIHIFDGQIQYVYPFWQLNHVK